MLAIAHRTPPILLALAFLCGLADSARAEIETRTKLSPAERHEPFLELSVGKPTFFIGERVPLEVTVFVHKDTSLNVEQNAPRVAGDNFVVGTFSGPWKEIRPVGSHDTYTYKGFVTALRPGKFVLGPAVHQCDVRVPEGFRRPLKRFTVTAEPVLASVKGIPQENRPESFYGAIGSYTMRVDADPLQLAVGEPVFVNLNIGGTGNFDAVRMPGFAGSDEWKLHPARKYEVIDKNSREFEGVTFSQAIIPRRPHKEIPSYEFTFFDPEDERFVTVRTDPIPVEIRIPADGNPFVAEAKPPPSATRPLPDVETPAASMEDILTIRYGEGSADLATVVRPVYKSPVFWAAQSAPLAALAGIFVLFFRRKESGSGASVPRERNLLFSECLSGLRALPPGTKARDFFAAACACLDAWEQAGRDTPGDGNRLAGQLRGIRQKHDFLHYAKSGSAASEPIPPAQRDAVLETLEHLADHEAH